MQLCEWSLSQLKSDLWNAKTVLISVGNRCSSRPPTQNYFHSLPLTHTHPKDATSPLKNNLTANGSLGTILCCGSDNKVAYLLPTWHQRIPSLPNSFSILENSILFSCITTSPGNSFLGSVFKCFMI